MGIWSHLLKKFLLENFNFFAVLRLSLKLYYEGELGSNIFILKHRLVHNSAKRH